MVDERYDPAFQRDYEEPEPEALPRRNPWLILLWVLAAVLIVAGAFVISQTTSTGGDTATAVIVLPVVFAALAPWLIGTGLAALVGAVFVNALRQ